MAHPKRKTSKSRHRRRARSHKRALVLARPCPHCGEAQQPHRVCPSCGMYRGRQVVTLTADK